MSETTATLIGRAGRAVTVAACAAGWLFCAALLWRTSTPGLDLGDLDERDYFSARTLERAHTYANGERALWVLGTLASLVALVVLARRLPRSVRGMGLGRVSSAIIVGMVMLTTLWLVALPFGVAQLWWQHHWGLGPFDVFSWLIAQRYALGAGAAFAMATIALVVGLAGRFPRYWWIPGSAAVLPLVVLLVFVSGWLASAGTRDVRSASLRADIARFQRAQGVSPPVREMKVSEWTDQANAFAAGFGPSTNVVLWDTLLDGRFSPDEVNVVVSHELAHVQHRHILKGIGWYALFLIPTAFLVAEATRRRGGMRDPANLPIAYLALTLITLATAPFSNAVTRRYEAEADWRALQVTNDPVSAKKLFQGFQKTSLADPEPPLLDYLWLETHPTIMQRIAMAEAARERDAR